MSTCCGIAGITFDGVSVEGTGLVFVIPNGYEGLNWTSVFVTNATKPEQPQDRGVTACELKFTKL